MANAKMNVSDVMQDMRKRGCKIGYYSLVRGAELGLYPFMVLLNVSDGGRRNYMILRRAYEKWADENLGGYAV